MKKPKCVTDGCNEQQQYSVVFSDGVRGKYCEDCTNYFQFFNKYHRLKSVKKLEVKGEQCNV
jgi:hypothetical protein